MTTKVFRIVLQSERSSMSRTIVCWIVVAAASVMLFAGVSRARADSTEMLDNWPAWRGLLVNGVAKRAGPPVQAQSGQEREPQRAADLASIERRIQAVYEQVGPAIVRFAYGKDPERRLGTGVIITADGHVVTSSSHPPRILQDDLLAFHLADGRRARGKALGWSSEFRIGLLKITQRGPWPHVDLGNRAVVRAGQLCVRLGYPDYHGDPDRPAVELDRTPTLYLSSVTKSAAPIWLTSSCMFTAGALSVFDLEGRLLGLTMSSSPKRDELHTSIEMLKIHWDDLVAGKNLDRVRLLLSEAEVGESPVAPRGESKSAGEKERVAAMEKAKQASVRVRLAGGKRNVSGTIVTADGYVITCGHHGRLPGEKVTVSLSDGRDANAVVLAKNRVCDIGLVKINDERSWPHVEMGYSTIMRPGHRCVVIGYPEALPGRKPWIWETRIIKRTQTKPVKDEWNCEFCTSGHPEDIVGASGGGVFDLQGRVVGVLSGVDTTVHKGERGGEMYHARAELFRKQWDFLAASKPIDVLDTDPLAEITAAFVRIEEDLPPIAVEVLADGEPRALGTIVGSEGRILTKASELAGAVSCRLADGRILPASVRKVSREHDLAILKIDAAGLPEARFSPEESIAPGILIAAIVPGQPPRVGVVSLAARPSPPVTGELGVILGDGDRGLEVHEVVASAATHGYDVPLRKGDVVVHVGGQPTPDFDAYRALIRPELGAAIAYAGDLVRVAVRRGRDKVEFRFPLLPFNFFSYDARTTSRRWWGFPSVFGTDIRLTPTHCGGPVINRSGRVVGIAIACRVYDGIKGERHVIPAHVARGMVVD